MYQKYIRQKITASLESLTVYRLIPLNKNFELRPIEFGRLLTFRPYNDIGVLNPDKDFKKNLSNFNITLYNC